MPSLLPHADGEDAEEADDDAENRHGTVVFLEKTIAGYGLHYHEKWIHLTKNVNLPDKKCQFLGLFFVFL